LTLLVSNSDRIAARNSSASICDGTPRSSGAHAIFAA
jgi:hypothetical protein